MGACSLCSAEPIVTIVHTFYAFKVSLCSAHELSDRESILTRLVRDQGVRRRAAIQASVRRDKSGEIDENYFDWRTFNERFGWVEEGTK